MENMNNLEKEILDIAEQVEKELEAGGLTSGIYLNWLQEVCKRVVEIEMHRVRKQVDQEIEKAREEGYEKGRTQAEKEFAEWRRWR